MPTVIKVENLSKYYRLGLIGGKTLHDDLNRWWARVRKQPDPLLKIGQEDRQNGSGEYIWALRDINFEVQQGEIVGIIGRNGAGKSTLLKILSRITAPTSGQVKVKGRIASLLEVGTGFHPELTGRENIYLNGAILGMKKIEIDRKFDEIVAFAEVEKFIDTPVKRYSSGMYVRLAFAVAAHLEPEILVVDEVLAVGDVAFQKKCLGKMGDVAKEGRTVLFVSHNMAAVENLCQYGVVLNQGKIQFAGSKNEAITQYLKNFTSSEVSLRERNDRVGSNEIRIVSIDIKDMAGRVLDVIVPGQDIDVNLHYEVTGDIPKNKILAGIQIKTQIGANVVFHHNRLTKELFSQLPNKGKFVCRIKNLLLTPAEYSLDYFIMANAGYGGHYLDWMKDAFRLKVVENDFYGTGDYVSSSHSHYLIYASWAIQSNE